MILSYLIWATMEPGLTLKKKCVEMGQFNPPQNNANLFDMAGCVVCFSVGL